MIIVIIDHSVYYCLSNHLIVDCHNFLSAMSSDRLFCSTNSPTPKDIQFRMIEYKENNQPVFLHFCDKWLKWFIDC